jgi:hypothetical protein
MAAQQSKGALGFLPEVSPEAAEANRRYMEAQRKLAETLDVRKNRTFDPMWLAAAQGFLGPTRTGSAFEAFGRVAGNLGEAQVKEQELAKQIAGQELELAGAGIGLERMRQRDRAFQQMLGQGAPAGQQTTLSTSRGGLPAVGGEEQPAQQGALPAPPRALAGLPGQQVAPPNPDFMSAADYINISRFDPNADPAKIMKDAQDLEQKRVEIRERGAFDRATGMYYQFPTGELVEREIAGTGKTYKVTPQQAIQLDIYQNNNDPKYWDVADQIIKGVTRPGEPAAAPAARPAAPGAAAPGRPAFRSTSEAKAEAAEAETMATERARGAVKKEQDLEADLATADKITFVTTQARDQIKNAPAAIGVLAKPGVGAAIGTLISEGVKVGQTSIGIPAIEEAIRKTKTNVTQDEINQVQSLAGNLAELELLYTQMYIKGQGAVTEGERAVVRRIPGTTSTDPRVLDEKMRLLQMRADYDRRRIEAFQAYMEREGARGNYIKFERSQDFKDIREQFQQDLYSAFNLKRPGSSSAPARSGASAPASGGMSASTPTTAPSGTANDFLREIQRRRAEGKL